MSGTPLYTYHLSGRRLATGFALGVTLVLLATASYYGAPWFFYAPVGFAAVMLVWAIIRNPKSGVVVSAEALRFFHASNAEHVLIADIASMTVHRWSDGPDTVMLLLKSGRTVHIPSLCADSQLAPILRMLGVAEVRAEQTA